MDGVAGRSFSAGSVPSLDKLMTDVTKTVPESLNHFQQQNAVTVQGVAYLKTLNV